MPKLKNKLPAYRHHKASGQAVVTLNARDIYLGKHNSAESREIYKRVVQEWLTNHARVPCATAHAVPPKSDLTINELFLAYWEFVQGYYLKNGTPTSEVWSIKRALTSLIELYGSQPTVSFGPLSLKTYRQRASPSPRTIAFGAPSTTAAWAAKNLARSTNHSWSCIPR